jgi:hypothetical protein
MIFSFLSNFEKFSHHVELIHCAMRLWLFPENKEQ